MIFSTIRDHNERQHLEYICLVSLTIMDSGAKGPSTQTLSMLAWVVFFFLQVLRHRGLISAESPQLFLPKCHPGK